MGFYIYPHCLSFDPHCRDHPTLVSQVSESICLRVCHTNYLEISPYDSELIIIDESGDLIVQVTEFAHHDGREGDVIAREGFRVCKATLIEHSPVFAALLSLRGFAESAQTTVELKEDRVMSMEILFRVLHKSPLQKVDDILVEEMWPLVMALEKYDLDIKIFQDWFKDWYKSTVGDSPKTSEAAKLLYPCWIFQHAPAFGSVTRLLAYESVGHIMEYNPTRHYELHMPSRVIRESIKRDS